MHTQVIVGDLDCATQDLPKLRLQFPSFIYKIFPHRVTSLQEKKKKRHNNEYFEHSGFDTAVLMFKWN